MTTISNLSFSGNYGYSTSNSPVSSTSDPALALTAASLSAEGSVVSMLGGGSAGATYDAAGLLNSWSQAGTAPANAPSTGNAATATLSTDQMIASTLAASPAASGVYTASGSIQGLGSGTSSAWANALSQDPGLAASVISASVNQGIVGTLSTIA